MYQINLMNQINSEWPEFMKTYAQLVLILQARLYYPFQQLLSASPQRRTSILMHLLNHLKNYHQNDNLDKLCKDEQEQYENFEYRKNKVDVNQFEYDQDCKQLTEKLAQLYFTIICEYYEYNYTITLNDKKTTKTLLLILQDIGQAAKQYLDMSDEELFQPRSYPDGISIQSQQFGDTNQASLYDFSNSQTQSALNQQEQAVFMSRAPKIDPYCLVSLTEQLQNQKYSADETKTAEQILSQSNASQNSQEQVGFNQEKIQYSQMCTNESVHLTDMPKHG